MEKAAASMIQGSSAEKSVRKSHNWATNSPASQVWAMK